MLLSLCIQIFYLLLVFVYWCIFILFLETKKTKLFLQNICICRISCFTKIGSFVFWYNKPECIRIAIQLLAMKLSNFHIIFIINENKNLFRIKFLLAKNYNFLKLLITVMTNSARIYFRQNHENHFVPSNTLFYFSSSFDTPTAPAAAVHWHIIWCVYFITWFVL